MEESEDRGLEAEEPRRTAPQAEQPHADALVSGVRPFTPRDEPQGQPKPSSPAGRFDRTWLTRIGAACVFLLNAPRPQPRQASESITERSNAVGRVLYVMLGTCLFSVVTLMGQPDSALLSPEAQVTLPALSYPLAFDAFLVVGPLLVSAFCVFLHILWAEHRTSLPPRGSGGLAIFDLEPLAARFMTWMLLYLVAPATLLTFFWKAIPRAEPLTAPVAFSVAAILAFLQIRRSAGSAVGVRALVAAGSIASVLAGGWWLRMADRSLNLFRAPLADQDLRGLARIIHDTGQWERV